MSLRSVIPNPIIVADSLSDESYDAFVSLVDLLLATFMIYHLYHQWLPLFLMKLVLFLILECGQLLSARSEIYKLQLLIGEL